MTAAKKAARAKRLAAMRQKYAATIARWVKSGVVTVPPVLEYRFHKRRRWKFDYAWPERRVAIEVQGGGPRHHHATRKGVENDYVKTCTAQVMGWRVLPMTPRQFCGQFGESVMRATFGTGGQ